MEPLTRILFTGLWCLADRQGRLEDRPKKIKVEVLPYDSCQVNKMLQNLHEKGFIFRYQINGCNYIQILNFLKHQNPHVKEAESTIPEPDRNSAKPIQTPYEHGSSPADSLFSDSPFLDSRLPDPGAVSVSFETFWETYPSRNGKKIEKEATLKRFKKLKPDEIKLLLIAVKNFAKSERVKNGIGIKDPKRWIKDGEGNEPWRDWIEPEQSKPKPRPPGEVAPKRKLEPLPEMTAEEREANRQRVKQLREGIGR